MVANKTITTPRPTIPPTATTKPTMNMMETMRRPIVLKANMPPLLLPTGITTNTTPRHRLMVAKNTAVHLLTAMIMEERIVATMDIITTTVTMVPVMVVPSLAKGADAAGWLLSS